MATLPRIVIIGAGFGGIELAKALKYCKAQIILVDRNNYHNFQPLMYQVATGGMEPDSIAYPVRRIFRMQNNLTFRMGEVTLVDWERSKLHTTIGTIPYDYLVIATGSTTNYFNFEPQKEELLTLKSVPDALNIRSYLYQNLEKALADYSGESLEEIMRVAVVGGGPAGIELAGALAEMKKHVIPKDFPDLDTSRMRIHLYQSGDRVLKAMSESASANALRYLEELGVNVHLNSRVSAYENDCVMLEDGSCFPTDTVLWTAGVCAAPVKGLPKEAYIRGNRIQVDAINRVAGTKEVFAIGDVAACITEENPRGLPMLAPVAQQQGKHLAKNLNRLLRKKETRPFRYKDKGVMATVGRAKAVADLPFAKLRGAFAWFIWMGVHVFSLVGFRNKLSALYQWAFNYVSYDRPLGLIIRPYRRETNNEESK